MKVLGVLLSLVLSWSVYANEGLLNEKSVIDHHLHVACFGYQSKCYLGSRARENWRFWFYQKIFDFSESEAKRHGDGYIFDKLAARIKKSKYLKKAVVLAMDQVYTKEGVVDKDHTEFYVPNEFVAEHARRLPEFEFAASVHPYRPDALEALVTAREMGAVYVKLLPAIQRFFINDSSLKDYYHKLVELDLPLLIHVDDESSFSQESQQFSEPAHLEFPLSLGVTVIVAHAASNGERDGRPTREIVLELAKRYPQLIADVSALTIFTTRKGHLQQIVNSWSADRLFYGSDFPLTTNLLSSPWYYLFTLGFQKTWEIAQISNLWDRDIALKRALGLPVTVFHQSLVP
ncbi:MAG: amidohydrolase family protein [Bdellovibrionales bacterium]|nr:amidohydrolase family protein [Bdellovibrionales bacterium]